MNKEIQNIEELVQNKGTEHFERAKKTVGSWPVWKQRVATQIFVPYPYIKRQNYEI